MRLRPPSHAREVVASLLTIAALGWVATPALADRGTSATKSALTLAAAPAFGGEGVDGDGWFEVVARVDNPSPTARRGSLVLTRDGSWRGSDERRAARVPFSVGGGGSAVVRIPTHGAPLYPSTALVKAFAEDETLLGEVEVSLNEASDPLLVDVANPSRLASSLRGSKLVLVWDPTRRGGARARSLSVGSPTYDPKTGDPILPAHAESYSPVTVLLLHSDVLAHLEDEPRDALVHWVLSGGTLAVVPTRPEDLRSPALTGLAGGVVHAARGHEAIAPLVAPPPARPRVTTTNDPDESNVGDEDDDNKRSPMAAAPPHPPDDVASHFVGYAGGALAPSAFGASTSYGLGEVHLLGFDPSERPMVDDPWVQARLRALVERAWERRARIAFPHGGAPANVGDTTEIRRGLDPNETFRAPLAFAAIILAIYSILVGPVLFARAARLGRPLSPLTLAPLVSAATFVLIVFVGHAGKGFRGRARRVALVEAQEGAQSGPVRRYRGFFSSRAESLSIAATDRTCLLDVVSADTEPAGQGTLRVDRNGVALEGLTSLPWQTVVVREDGFMPLGSGISLGAAAGDELAIENLTPYEIRDAIVASPAGAFYYFESLPPRSKKLLHEARAITGTGLDAVSTAGLREVHSFAPHAFQAAVSGPAGARIAEMWRPMERAAGDAVDWFPEGTPVLLGELVRADETASDSGLRVESSRVLIRVLGREKAK